MNGVCTVLSRCVDFGCVVVLALAVHAISMEHGASRSVEALLVTRGEMQGIFAQLSLIFQGGCH